MHELFKSIAPKTAWELRAYAMLNLAANLGLRSNEISLITLDDIYFEKAEIKLTNRKKQISNYPAITFRYHQGYSSIYSWRKA